MHLPVPEIESMSSMFLRKCVTRYVAMTDIDLNLKQ